MTTAWEGFVGSTGHDIATEQPHVTISLPSKRRGMPRRRPLTCSTSDLLQSLPGCENSRLSGSLSRTASLGTLSRPTSGKLSRPTSSLLRRPTSRKVPPKKATPLSFEDIYSEAKGRVKGKSVADRGAFHKSSLASSLTNTYSSCKVPGAWTDSVYVKAQVVEDPSRNYLDVVENSWADACLSSISSEHIAEPTSDHLDEEDTPLDPQEHITQKHSSSGSKRSCIKSVSGEEVNHFQIGSGKKTSCTSSKNNRNDPEQNPVDYQPSLDIRLQTTKGFTSEQLAKMRIAFHRFLPEGDFDIHKDTLKELLVHLGFLMSDDEAKILEIADQVSVHSQFDFKDFCEFVDKFSDYERELFKKEFDQFDLDASGVLDVKEVENFLQKIGITPVRATIQEALLMVDCDSSGSISFSEFLNLITIYRQTEGFRRDELTHLQEVYDHYAELSPGSAGAMVESELPKALVFMMGPQAEDLAKRLIKTLQERMPGCKSKGNKAVTGNIIHFQEFMVWARRMRQAEVEEYRKKFNFYDTDENGIIDRNELALALRHMGYTPLKVLIDELMATASHNDAQVLQFYEFVTLMSEIHVHDGFSRSEVKELKELYDKFDSSGKEEMSHMQVERMLQSMGYVVHLEEVRKYIAAVDFDDSGTLDFHEFLRMLRRFREDELDRTQTVFESYKDPTSGLMPKKCINSALDKLGLRSENIMGTVDDDLAKLDGPLDFDMLVILADSRRKTNLLARRKRAGFSDQEIQCMAAAFRIYDKNGDGEIDREELTRLLQDLHIPMHTTKDQKKMLAKVEEAKTAVTNAGASEEEVGQVGTPSVRFWVLVQLVRMIRTQIDDQEAACEADLAHQTHFTIREVEEFREVFEFWTQKIEQENYEASRISGSLSVMAEHLSPLHSIVFTKSSTLSFEGVRRVMKSLGLQVKANDRRQLEDYVSTMQLREPNAIDFGSFLIIMRWAMRSNFCGINDFVKKALQEAAPGHDSETHAR